SGEKGLVPSVELGWRSRRRDIDETVRSLLVEPDHPVPQGLAIHATNLGGLLPRVAAITAMLSSDCVTAISPITLFQATMLDILRQPLGMFVSFAAIIAHWVSLRLASGRQTKE